MTSMEDDETIMAIPSPIPSNNNSTSNTNPTHSLLSYRIADYSSYSAAYRPELVLEDHPTDQASRWSSASNDQHQYLTLELTSPAIPLTITFGKFHKNHVCNLREFRVELSPLLTSSTPGSMIVNSNPTWVEVLQSGLRNDSEPECFPLVYPSPGSPFPVHQIKIHPLAAWGNSFNYSIWYVEVRGIRDPTIITEAARRLQERLWSESWRLCLKFLREQSIIRAQYEQIAEIIPVRLEAPLVNQLYYQIIERGNLAAAEQLLQEAHQADPELFTEYLTDHVVYEPQWTRLDSSSLNNGNENDDAEGERPGVRGGHQMAWDPVGMSLYLLGGWDGHRDLADFWRYDVNDARWTLLSDDTRKEGGPGPRSCHKMILHSGRRRLYVLGRYVDTETRNGGGVANANGGGTIFQSDFFYYDLEQHTWTLVAGDTSRIGGPGLVYDHQMALDEERDVIYVFGGRLLGPSNGIGSIPSVHGGIITVGGGGNAMTTGNNNNSAITTTTTTSTTTTTTTNTTATNNPPPMSGEATYGGLYAYCIRTDRWRLIRHDGQSGLCGTPIFKSRIGHSMIFNPRSRHLYIYAGQRHKDYLCDFYVYDVDRDQVVEMIKDTGRVGGPEAGFTQRSTLDGQRQELFIFSGLMREKAPTLGQGGGGGSGSGGGGATATTTITTPSSNLGAEMARNSLWLYQISKRRWTRIHSRHTCYNRQPNTLTNISRFNGNQNGEILEPCPRFAHQLVYDPEGGIHYLFGGNPGEVGNPRRRLSDFWQLRLIRPLNNGDVVRRAAFALRKQQFYELCLQRRLTNGNSGNGNNNNDGGITASGSASSPSMLNALRFLQGEVSLAVDHDRIEESQQFRELSTWLVQAPGDGPTDRLIEQSRRNVFNVVISFLPASMRPPLASLSNLVQ